MILHTVRLSSRPYNISCTLSHTEKTETATNTPSQIPETHSRFTFILEIPQTTIGDKRDDKHSQHVIKIILDMISRSIARLPSRGPICNSRDGHWSALLKYPSFLCKKEAPDLLELPTEMLSNPCMHIPRTLQWPHFCEEHIQENQSLRSLRNTEMLSL